MHDARTETPRHLHHGGEAAGHGGGERGLPIGSGVTESTAKNVVNMRTKRSGQRWSIPGLQGVLTLRALLKSDHLARFWSFLSRRYVVNVSILAPAA